MKLSPADQEARLGSQQMLVDEQLPASEKEWQNFREQSRQKMPIALSGKALPDILLDHQKEILSSTSKYSLTVTDKSRRIGATWGVGADAVLTAGSQKSAGGMDVLYIGYNLDMAREFIDTCAMWSKAFMPAASSVDEFLFTDQGEDGKEDKHIKAFRITFASGFEITALSSRPRSLRGRQGYVILDEFAFHDDAEGLLKAAMALIIWGGKVLVISTHNGADNPFNTLIEDIRKGQYGDDANVTRCTFDDAIKQGLFERICLMKGEEWSAVSEAKWRENIRKIYRHNSAEELDCIPSEGTGVYLTRSQIEDCTVQPDTVVTLKCDKAFVSRDEAYRTSYITSWLEQNVKPLLDKLDPDLQHAFGLDFARSADVSCGVPLEIQRDLTRRAPFVIEMRNVPYEQQKQIVIYILKRLPRFMGAKFDATGNGGYLAEVAMQRFGENLIERVSLSQAWYQDNMPKMKDGIEGKRLLFPANDNLVSDMRMIQLVRGIPKVPEGKTLSGSDGEQRHGDFAIALCLSNAASLGDVLTYDGFKTVSKDYHQKRRGDYHPEDEPAFGRGGRMGGMNGAFG